MDNQNIDKIIENLPKEVQSLLSESVWEDRVREVSKKYGLNDSQADSLANIVLFIIIGVDDAGNLETNIQKDLGVSSLMSEQIAEDLDKRVFEYAVKYAEEKKGKKEESNAKTETQIEIRPENLPVASNTKVGVPKYVPLGNKQSLPQNKPETQSETPATGSKINYGGAPNSSNTIQKPISVPRFTMDVLEEEKTEEKANTVQNQPIKSTLTNIIGDKLNSITSTTKGVGEKLDKPADTASVSPKPYSVDPYREPLE